MVEKGKPVDTRRMVKNPGVNMFYGPFVLVEDCTKMSGKIVKQLEAMNSDTKQIKESLYGIERAGKVKGGLVNMFQTYIEAQEQTNQGMRWVVEKILLPLSITGVTLAVSKWILS